MTSIQMFNDLKKMILSASDDYFNEVEKETLKFLIASLNYHSEWRTMEMGGEMEFAPNIEELALLIRRIKNREHVVPYPITGNWADKLVQLEALFKTTERGKSLSLFESLNFSLKELLKTKWLVINSDLSYLQPLLDLSKDNATKSIQFDIFSLNNDEVIETYFKENQQHPWRGFVQGEWIGLSREENESEFGRINLYKLHGSVDWIRLEDFSLWETEKLKERNPDKYNEIMQSIESNPFIHYPYVIFGQGTKTFSIEPFFSFINHFNTQLNGDEKDYIFVIGYNFFDPYINNLLFNAAKDHKNS